MPSYTLRLATPADDPALRRLLRENPMPGDIALTYEREPNFFIASGVDGPLSQTILAEEEGTGALLGMGARIVRPLYLNGAVTDVGLMSHLRVERQRPWGLSMARQLSRAFGTFRALHEQGGAPFYLMSVIDGNVPARRILASGLPGLPLARPWARMVTYAISPRRPRPPLRLPRGTQLRRATPQHVPALLDCLQRAGAQSQFAPYWGPASLFSPAATPNLAPEDFFIVERGSRVTACLALWDQTPFKQTVVRGYAGAVARFRPLINRLARVADIPALPPPGAAIPTCFASHLAIDGRDPALFAALLRAAYNETARRGFAYFLIGLSEADPLRRVLARAYLHIPYRSQVYLMAWEDGLDAVAKVDGRLPGLEIAVL